MDIGCFLFVFRFSGFMVLLLAFVGGCVFYVDFARKHPVVTCHNSSSQYSDNSILLTNITTVPFGR